MRRREVREVEVVILVKRTFDLSDVLEKVRELQKDNPHAKFRIEVEWWDYFSLFGYFNYLFTSGLSVLPSR